jgi:hypothetical protein
VVLASSSTSAKEAADMLKKTFSALTIMAALGGSLVLPVAAQAQGISLRFYDRSHKDYHRWNSDEDRRYREYLNEQHRRYRAFSRTNRVQQREYWRWRHDHDGR